MSRSRYQKTFSYWEAAIVPHRLLYALTGLILGLVVIGGGSFTVAAESARDKALNEALETFRKGDYETAAKAFRPLAEEGDPVAQYNLGFLAAEGLGMPQDDRAAARWFRRAAMAGHAKAQNHLGLMYFEGRGVTRDFSEAFVFFELAAVGGLEDAAKNRLIVARKMSSEQISASQKKAGKLLGVLRDTTQKAPPPPSLANGVIVTTDGLILTLADVVNDCTKLRVLYDGEFIDATLVAADHFNKIALLSIPGPIALVPVLGDIAVQPRQKVWLAAFRRDDEDRPLLTLAETVVAQSPGLERVDERYLEIAALPQMTVSGAPVFDDGGVLIGLLSPGTSANAVARIRGAAPDAAAFALRVQITRILLDTVGGTYRLASTADTSQEPPTEDIIRGSAVAIECINPENAS